jgi:FkbM family methyltransferase
MRLEPSSSDLKTPNMDVRAKIGQVVNIARHSKTPLPLLLDLLRVKRSDYVAACKGLEFALKAHRHEWFAVYETIINEDYLRHGVVIRPGDTIVDVGAGFGTFALLAARKAGPDGLVVAYEPDPELCARARLNAARNGFENVRVTDEAVGDADGAIGLLLQPWHQNTPTLARVDDRPARTDREIRVPVRSIRAVIDAVEGPIALLKLHCEGAEYGILDHVDPERAGRIGQIVLEAHRIDGRAVRELVDRLTALNFRPVYRHPMIFALRAGERGTARGTRADGERGRESQPPPPIFRPSEPINQCSPVAPRHARRNAPD